MDFNNCKKSPSKGGKSRADLNKIAKNLGLDPSKYQKKEELCDALEEANKKMKASKKSKDTPKKSKDTPKKSTIKKPKKKSSKREDTSFNYYIAQLLIEAADLAYASDSKTYRGDALNRAANTIKELDFVIDNVEDIKDIPTIGEGVIRRVKEILDTDELSELNNSKTFSLFKDLQKIQGISNKTALKLIKKDVSSIDDLLKKYKNGDVSLTDEQIVGVKYFNDFNQRIPRREVKKIGDLVINAAKEIDDDIEGHIVGSYRRESPTSGDVDILLVTDEDNILNLVVKKLKKKGLIQHTLDIGNHKFSGTYFSDYPENNKILRKIDINIAEPDDLATALMHHTGSVNFNIDMRNKAKKLNMKLNQYGLYKDNKRMKTETEKDIFDILGEEYVKPKDRK